MDKKLPLKSPVLLEKNHVVDNFDCGVDALNSYLQQYAYINNQNNSARTYAALGGDNVVGYYTLAAGSVEKEEAPTRVGKGLARHPIPVIILARLAVNKTEQNAGLGKGLLQDALLRIVKAADIIGGRAVLVHAKDEKAALFYKKFGFEESPVNIFYLYLLLKDIKKTLGT